MMYLHSLGADAHVVYHANGRPEFVSCEYTDCAERCSGTDAMDLAASNGHLEAVKFLHNFTSRGCTAYAVDWAARKGHIQVVRFLFYNRPEEVCVASALSMAASVNWGHNMVDFLTDHCSGDEILAVLIETIMRNELYVGMLLYRKLRTDVSVYGALEAATVRDHTSMVRFFFQSQARESIGFLKQAVAKSSSAAVVYILAASRMLAISTEELRDALAFASELNELHIRHLLLGHIEGREKEASQL